MVLRATAVAFSALMMASTASALDRVVIVPAHPDDLISCLGFAHLAKGLFELHVVDLTHGERGCGDEKFRSGWTKAKRTREEQAVCDSIGAKLHWLDEIDGEAHANRETCEKLAALLKEIQPRAVFAHWPVDIHTDHVMAGAAAQRAIFLAGIRPEIYFFEETYQAKRFVPDVFVDFSSVCDKVWESLRLYECQYRDGTMERRRRGSADFYGWHSSKYCGGRSEGYMSFVQPMQGEKTIFSELPPPYPGERGVAFQGARTRLPEGGAQRVLRDDSAARFEIRNPVWPCDAPDPTVWQDDAGNFYLASTHQDILVSRNLTDWKKTGRKLLDAGEYAEIAKTWPHVWAPAVKRIGGWYVLYLSFHNTGAHTAVVSYRSKSPTGPFRERNVLVTSEGDGKFEVIDPDVAFEDGRAFLFFGHGDVRRVELTPDGRARKPGSTIEHVAGLALGRKPNSGLNGWQANSTEGSYLYRRDGWWYLFVSEGSWVNHTYRVSVGRARRLTDAFFDRAGRPMAEGAATVILSSGKDDEFYGPGHNGEIVERNGRTYMFYHCHWTKCEKMIEGEANVKVGSRYIPRVLLLQEILWADDGWPYFGNGGKPVTSYSHIP